LGKIIEGGNIKTYTIKSNGYIRAVVRGKKTAVECLKKFLAWDGVMPEQQKWKNTIAGILCTADNNSRYSIEESNGG
jgi:RecB family endonuclease NucS